MADPVLGLVQRTVGVLSNITGIVDVINGHTAHVSQDSFYLHTSDAVDLILEDDADILSLIVTNQATLTSQLDDIEATLASIQVTLATLQTAAEPVTLPASAPTTFLDGIGASGFAGVWDQEVGNANGDHYVQVMAYLAGIGESYTFSPVRDALNPPFWSLFSLFVPFQARVVDVVQPNSDPTAILETDTLLTWLQSQNPDFTISGPFDGAHYQIFVNDNKFVWECLIDEVQFEAFKAVLFPPGTAVSAPVWPGLDNVELGTPVELDLGVTITEPMDGVLIEIVTAPAKQGFFTFDDVLSYRNVGALAFFTDRGDEEFPQTLGFQDAIYAPKTMQQAAGVKVRTSVGITGTITPYTITL
jgi:hypothetical protein